MRDVRNVSHEPLSVSIPDSKQSLGRSDVEALVERAARGEVPPLAETLLADAHFYAWWASHPNPRMGLVLAATACEVKTKEVLRRTAAPDAKEIVEVVIRSRRPVEELLDRFLEASAGISLRKDVPELFGPVKTLFDHRNAFAHRGDTSLDAQAIREDLRAATRAFDWLDRLVERVSGTTLPRPVERPDGIRRLP